MRESYREDLNGVVDDLVGMTERVRHAVRLSTQALLEADLVIDLANRWIEITKPGSWEASNDGIA